jgi:hypothetical protein
MSGGRVKLGPDNIISELRNWKLESESDHNDGYIKKHYKEHLQAIFDEVDQLRKSKEEIEIEIEKQKWICTECGRSTFETDYDYLASPTLHMACALEQMK